MLGKVLTILTAIPLAFLLAVGVSALYALPVQWLFNYLSPFDIAFKQAWALSLLCSLLFKSSK